MAAGQTKRLLKSKSGLRIVPTKDCDGSPFELAEPPWALDQESSHCVQCHHKFDFLTRRHHCRRCGYVYCGICCGQRLPLQRMCFVDPVRVCQNCQPATLRENDFYDRHLHVLLRGAKFMASQQDSSSSMPCTCKLTSSHRLIEVKGSDVLDVPVLSVNSFHMLRGSPGDTNSSLNGVVLDYGSNAMLQLEVIPGNDATCAVQWLVALYKALKMISDTHA
ncbi:zinc finger FYVE domain-containing protein 21-like isoform X1 [Ornithodoros turicata]|uniref:zinc finger FYVE domain-containing protein 21-like isoform X1 n=1 Tax=Ornithodoros turicata TaxID=34597 RepID=UPI0031395A75